MRLLVQEGEYTILTCPECEAPVEVCATSDQLRDASRAEGRDQERQRVLRLIDKKLARVAKAKPLLHTDSAVYAYGRQVLDELRRQVESGEEQ